jgi:transcriptional regulator NrdR family protein
MEHSCPICSGESAIVERRGTRRRRECGVCHHRWTTYEISAERLERLEKIEQYATAIAQAIKDEV